MLIERQLAPALIIIGGALILPDVIGAYGNGSASVSTLGLVAGNLLGGAGLYLSALMAIGSERKSILGVLLLILLGLCAVFFAGGTFRAAFHAAGFRAFMIGGSALIPLTGYLEGIRAGFKE